MLSLTKTQATALAFLIDFQERNGYAPTYRQMATGLGFRSPSNVHRVVQQLQARGHLRRHGERFSKASAYEIIRPRPLPKATIFLRTLIERIEYEGSISADDPLVELIRGNLKAATP